MVEWLVIDTSVLLGGFDPPPGRWVTTPEASQEVTPGGKDARRFEGWKDQGLVVRAAPPAAEDRVDEAALAAGNLGRLSVADRSLLALALELEGVLLTDDHTMLDVADRLDVKTQTMGTDGITQRKQWRPRCSGCGRWFDEPQKRDECPVCGSPVALKPWEEKEA